jgi:UDP-N-acetylmuramyl pentapeptide synthase
MAAALEVLKGVANGKTKIAILGYMPRLGSGDAAQKEYAKMGEKAVETNVDLLIVVGKEAREIGRRALEVGMARRKWGIGV